MPQATTIEQVTSIEIDFYEHEIYAGQKLIAQISYDHQDFVTQRWVVIVNDKEEFRAITQMKCHGFVTWHYKRGTLPIQQETPATTTGNEVMCEIAAQCEQFGFELLDDGIYKDEQKLGSIGCTDDHWWVIRATSVHQQKVPCDSAFEAVWSLSLLELMQPSREELLDKPFKQLTADVALLRLK